MKKLRVVVSSHYRREVYGLQHAGEELTHSPSACPASTLPKIPVYGLVIDINTGKLTVVERDNGTAG